MQVIHKVNYSYLVSLENILLSWDEFKRGKISKTDVMRFERYLEDNIFAIHYALSTKTYKHRKYKTFHIFDPKHRVISKASVKDRLIHHLVFNKLYEIFDPTFIFHSYSSRIDKGSHLAVENLTKVLRKESKNATRQTFVLKCDVQKFFQSIPHNKLLQIIQKRIKDKEFLWLIEEIVGSFSQDTGLPIGNLTSQVFANIILNELDQFIKQTLKVKYYFRYADDFAIVHKDKSYLQSVLKEVGEYLNKSLGLSLHPKKVSIDKFSQGIDFLGYVILPHHTVLRAKTKDRMLKKLWQGQEWLRESKIEGDSFYQSIQSYLGMLEHCDGYDLQNTIKNNFLS